MVEVVSQELGTGTATVPIVDAEEGTRWPRFVLSMLRLHYIEDDGNSVFVVITNQALVRVGGVGPYNAITLIAALGWLVIRDDYAGARGELKGSRLLLILVDHLVCVYDGEGSDLGGLSRVWVNFMLHIHALPIPLK